MALGPAQARTQARAAQRERERAEAAVEARDQRLAVLVRDKQAAAEEADARIAQVRTLSRV